MPRTFRASGMPDGDHGNGLGYMGMGKPRGGLTQHKERTVMNTTAGRNIMPKVNSPKIAAPHVGQKLKVAK